MSIKKNYFYNLIYQITNILLPLVTAPYISRVIGAEGIGIVSYSHSIALYFGMFGLLGLNNYGNREIAAIREDKVQIGKTFWSIYFLQIITTVFMFFCYLFFTIFFVKENKIIAYLQIIYLFSTVLDINWFFFGLEKFKITVSRNILIKVLSFILIIVFVKDRNDIYIYSLILVISMLFSQIVLWPFLKGEISFYRPSLTEIFIHLKPNIILFIPLITISIYKVMDKIMIGLLSNMFQTGIYENSLKIINIPMGIITALGVVMLPKMSNLFAAGKIEKSRNYIRKSMKFSMFLAFGMFFGLAGIANVLAPIFFGKEFESAGILIYYLSVTIIFISWANVIRAQYLIPNKREYIYILSVIFGAICNVLINILLIPSIGAKGAVFGTIIAEFIVTACQTFLVRNELPINLYFKDCRYFFISGILMYLLIFYIKKYLGITIFTLIVQILSGFLIYVILNIFFYFIQDRYKVYTFIDEVKNRLFSKD